MIIPLQNLLHVLKHKQCPYVKNLTMVVHGIIDRQARKRSNQNLYKSFHPKDTKSQKKDIPTREHGSVRLNAY